MIAFLAARMIAMGVTSRYAKAAAWAVIALVAIVLAYTVFVVYVHGREKRAVSEDRATATIEAQKRTIEADRAAETAKRERDDADGKRAEDLRVEAAKGTADPVGVGVNRTLERMRQQQKDRANRASH